MTPDFLPYNNSIDYLYFKLIQIKYHLFLPTVYRLVHLVQS